MIDSDYREVEKIVKRELNEVWRRISHLDKTIFIGVDVDNYSYESNSYIDELQENFKKLSKKVEALQSVDERNKSLEKEIIDLQEKNGKLEDRFSARKKELKRQIEALEEEKQSLLENIKSSKDEIHKLQEKNNRLELEKRSLQNKVDELEESKKALEVSNGDLNIQINGLGIEINNLNGKINSLKNEKEEMSSEIIILKNDKEKLKKEIQERQENVDALSANNGKLESEIQEVNSVLEKNKSEWNSAIEQYQDLMRLMYKCESLNALVQGFGLDVAKNAEDYKSVIGFVGMLGNGVTFATYLYNFWDGTKSQNRKALEANDYAFIDALNQYYEDLYDLEYKVLYYERESNPKFKKEIMKDIESPSRVYQSYSDVYVPAVMRNTEDVEKMMKVKGE